MGWGSEEKSCKIDFDFSFLTLPQVYAACTYPIQQIVSSMLRSDRELSNLQNDIQYELYCSLFKEI